MKRWIGSVVLACVAGIAIAQAPFTIVRPAEGSKVREKVRVQIPKNSIPAGGYIGVFLDGKFVEATLPPLEGAYYVYTLDTKGRQLPDGPKNLELVLYVDYNENPRIVSKSSVNINVANSSSIKVPAAGIKLRYGFRAGTEIVYTVQSVQSIATLSEVQNKMGGRAAEVTTEGQKFRLLYAVDNTYGNGDALIRMQPLPTKGKDYVWLTTTGSTEPRKYMDYEMHPIYMRINPTGNEIFGSLPNYTPFEGTAADSRTDLIASVPLPTFPTKAVKPGDSWQSKFQMGSIDLDKRFELNSVVEKVQARGEFVGVEWEMGHPCAKIRNTISQGTTTMNGKSLKEAGKEFSDPKVSLDETMWFALDSRRILKIVRTSTLEGKVAGAATGGAGRGGPGGGPTGAKGGGMGMSGAGLGGNMLKDPPVNNLQAGAGPPNDGGSGRQGGGLGTGGVGGGQPGGGRGGSSGGAQYIRIRSQQIIVIEQ